MTPSSSSSVVVLFALSVVAMATGAETSVILLARLVKTRSVSGGSENEGNYQTVVMIVVVIAMKMWWSC